jgi:hypothetical protein
MNYWREQMSNSKHGLKALLLATMAAVLGTMALAAVGAQGQTHTELLATHAKHEASLNPSPLSSPTTNTPGLFLFSGGTVLLATVAVSQIGTGILLVAGRSLEIRCTALNLNSGKIHTSTDGAGEATFTGCKAFDHKALTELKECKFVELETIKAKALVLPIRHGGENFILFEPLEGAKNFTIISFKEGTECPLPLNNPVTGSISALVDPETAEKLPRRLILFSEGIQLLTGDKLAFGGFPSYIKAHGEIQLDGPHAGEKLDIH